MNLCDLNDRSESNGADVDPFRAAFNARHDAFDGLGETFQNRTVILALGPPNDLAHNQCTSDRTNYNRTCRFWVGQPWRLSVGAWLERFLQWGSW